MLYKRRICMKWTSIIIAYICIFSLSFQYGVYRRHLPVETTTKEPRHLLIKRYFIDHRPYLNSSMISKMFIDEFQRPIVFENVSISKEKIRHGLVVFYDFSYHHVFFQQFLWLYASWIQQAQHRHIENDLIVFVSTSSIPTDFLKLANDHKQIVRRNRLKIYPCLSLLDSIVDEDRFLLNEFSFSFQMELLRLFYWQQQRLSSLLIFLLDEFQSVLRDYDFLLRLDFDSILMPKFSHYSPKSSIVLGESIVYDRYTLHRLERIRYSFSSTRPSKSILQSSMTICWFARFSLFRPLVRRTILLAVWMMKEEFTESERLHHLTYLNYPSWYLDGIFEYAAAIVFSMTFDRSINFDLHSPFDCHHGVKNCLDVSLRDPSHHLNLSKHALHLLTTIEQTNLTNAEVYILKTVIRSNRYFRKNFL